MKFVISLIVIALLAKGTHMLVSANTKQVKKTKNKKRLSPAAIATACVTIFLLGLLGYAMYSSAVSPDLQCRTAHSTASKPPEKLVTAADYFAQGNYDYDTGNCTEATLDYSSSIELDPKNPEVYNNRAYTNMRLHNFAAALTDLDRALALRPDYVNALMNRGDIYNFYYQVDHIKAIADYQKVISLGATHGNSVCGHLAMAESNNVVPLAFLRLLGEVNCR